MCGIFGIIRNNEAPTADARLRATEALLMLGIKSEERGLDSAGIALINTKTKGNTAPTLENAQAKATIIDNTTIIKDTVAFNKLPIREHLTAIDHADVIIGHTRAASQGKSDDILNASPFIAGALVGTHNGDISTDTLSHHEELKKEVFGGTDSEMLYRALNKARTDRRHMIRVLRHMNGRAALVFTDRTRPDRLYIARTALSPVSYAYTANGDFVYASNPDWFRQIEKETTGRVSFTDITLIPEGYFLTINTKTREIEDVRHFTPTCRENDLFLINTAVYRKFKLEDKKADKLLHRHKVASNKLGGWKEFTPAPTIDEKTTPISPEYMLWSPEADWDEKGFIQPEDEFAEEEVNIEELEALCWASGEFDHEVYMDIIEASPAEALEKLDAYREVVKEAFINGQTAPGFTIDLD